MGSKKTTKKKKRKSKRRRILDLLADEWAWDDSVPGDRVLSPGKMIRYRRIKLGFIREVLLDIANQDHHRAMSGEDRRPSDEHLAELWRS